MITKKICTESPFFLAPHKGDPGGVDYLGMRAINLQMMDDLLPGLNNVARQIRPFSLLSWTLWTYEKKQSESGQKMTVQGYSQYREKIESLFVLSHKHAEISVKGIAGANQPLVETKQTTLTFAALRRKSGNTLISAINYGPGLKGEGGLQFAEPHPDDRRVVRVGIAGKRLAVGLDEKLKSALKPKQYEFLCATKSVELRTTELEDYAPGWLLSKPSSMEKDTFYSRLVPIHPTNHRERARVSTIELIFAVWKNKRKELDVHELRRCMTMSTLPDLPDHVEEARGRWRALQLRQAQRLAMEVLFGWIERCIWQDNVHTTYEFADMMVKAIKKARPDWAMLTAVRDRLAYFGGLADDSDSLFRRGWKNLDCDLVHRSLQLEQQAKKINRKDEIVAEAFDILALVAVHTEHFLCSPSLAKYVINPAQNRLPLQWWASTMRANAKMPVRAFFTRMVETWLVSQHLGVAASRSSVDSSRMRLSIDDAGIGSLLVSKLKCWAPTLTADRLVTALELLHQCGKLQRRQDEDGEFLYSLPAAPN
jgi:hypothetical protein